MYFRTTESVIDEFQHGESLDEVMFVDHLVVRFNERGFVLNSQYSHSEPELLEFILSPYSCTFELALNRLERVE